MSRKRSAGEAAMRIDVPKGAYHWAWGPGRKKDRRIERAKRKEQAEAEIRESDEKR